jgi:hypothetical protein
MNILLPPVTHSLTHSLPPSLTRTAHHREDRLVTTLFYLPTYLTLSLSLSLSLYVSSTNFDNCGCQNPTTFFSCE